MTSTIPALATRGITEAQAATWVLNNLNNPVLIFNTARDFGLTVDNLATIIAVALPIVTPELVSSYFASIGLDGDMLVGGPATDESNEAGEGSTLSDAPIHGQIQSYVEFETTRGVEILQAAAREDLSTSYDGEQTYSSFDESFDRLVATYNMDDFESELNLAISVSQKPGADLMAISYGQKFQTWVAELNAAKADLKSSFDDVLFLNQDYPVIQLDDSESALVILDGNANENTIEGFSSSDVLYVGDSNVHMIDLTSSSPMNSALNWLVTNASAISDERIDLFVVSDGENAYLFSEKEPDQAYDLNSSADDFTALTLVGVSSDQLSLNDGMLTVA